MTKRLALQRYDVIYDLYIVILSDKLCLPSSRFLYSDLVKGFVLYSSMQAYQ